MVQEFTCEYCQRIFAVDTPKYPRRFCNKSCARKIPRPKMRKPLMERFWKYVEKTDTCWLWTAHRDKDGYGNIKEGDGSRRTLRAPAVSWSIHFGNIPDNQWILHHCDNPPCVRPDHLYLGDVRQNAADRVARNRSARGETSGRTLHPERWTIEKRPKGQSHGRSKLTEEDVLRIRSLGSSKLSQQAIADQFEISRPLVSLIINRKIWTHI